MRTARFVLTVLACAVYFGCSSGDHPIDPDPKASLSISPASSTVTTGQVLVVTITASNATNCIPEVIGARVVESNGCTSFSIIADNPGMVTIRVSATGPNGISVSAEPKQVTVMSKPVEITLDTANVQFSSPDESDSPLNGKVKFVWWKGALKDSVEKEVTANTSSTEVPVNADSVLVYPFGDPRYSTDRKVRMCRSDYYHKPADIILEPISWRIRSPQYAGQVVAVSTKAGEVLAGPNDFDSYHMMAKITRGSCGVAKMVVGLKKPDALIPVGFLWSRSGGYNQSTDSAYFTDVIFPIVNRHLGPHLVPGIIAGDTVPNGMIGIILKDDPADPKPSTMQVANIQTGEMYKGQITLPSRLYFESYRVTNVVHEIMHALGKGHTCESNTIMTSATETSPGGRCYEKRTQLPSPWDVAMYEMALAIRDLAKKKNTLFAFN